MRRASFSNLLREAAVILSVLSLLCTARSLRFGGRALTSSYSCPTNRLPSQKSIDGRSKVPSHSDLLSRSLSSSSSDINTMGDFVHPYRTLLLDMDGVLAEVSQSYRAAIIKTCHHFGATSVDDDMVTAWKARGNANDDWKLSYDLIMADPTAASRRAADEVVTLERVTEVFEELYQGHGDTPGLYKLETLIPTRETMLELRRRSRPGIGIVTGRPRSDCLKFLRDFDLQDLIDVTYCMEDGPSKPDPYPVRRACELLGVTPSASVVLVGDTPDDIRAAVSAGCRGVGVVTPEALDKQEAQGEPYHLATLGVAMKERGADHILRPGFAELVDMFPPPADN